MPSQHSQFQAFFAVFSILYLSSLRFDSRGARLFANFIKLFLVGICALVILSRVYLVYHYLYQCLWGAAFGSLFAVFWYWISEKIMEPFAYKRILSWWVVITNDSLGEIPLLSAPLVLKTEGFLILRQLRLPLNFRFKPFDSKS